MAPAWVLGLGVAAIAWGWKKLKSRQHAPRAAKRVRRPEPLASAGADELSIVVWNVLADFYAQHKTYPHCYVDHLDWEHRWGRIQEQLQSFQSDILCLQEVEPSRWQEYLSSPALAGYTGIIQDRKGGDSVIANALFYRPEKLQLVWQESRSRALLAAFVMWDGLGQQQMVYVANLHLEGSPYRPNDRVSQTRSALQRLEAHAAQHGVDPQEAALVVCGDFNSGRHEAVYSFLERGRLEGGTTEAHLPRVEVTRTTIAHPFPLHEAYDSGGAVLPFTRKVQRVCPPGSSSTSSYSSSASGAASLLRPWPNAPPPPPPAPEPAPVQRRRLLQRLRWLAGGCAYRVPALASTLDFIWCSAVMEVVGLYVPIECRHESLVRSASLPNQHYPSDHLPIGAVLRLKHFYVPPYGDVHQPPPPPAGAAPSVEQDLCAGQEGVEEEVLLGQAGAAAAAAAAAKKGGSGGIKGVAKPKPRGGSKAGSRAGSKAGSRVGSTATLSAADGGSDRATS